MTIIRILVLILLSPLILVLRLFGYKGREDMVYLPEDHEDMKKALAEARSTLPQFRQALLNPRPHTREFALKVRFPAEGGHEHCWVGDLSVDGNGFKGKLANEPQSLSLKIGDPVDVTEDMISDWAYFQDDVAQGHYSTRALLPHMSKKFKAKVLAVYGWEAAAPARQV